MSDFPNLWFEHYRQKLASGMPPAHALRSLENALEAGRINAEEFRRLIDISAGHDVERALRDNLRFWESRVVKYSAEMLAVKMSDEAVPPAGDKRDGPAEPE